MTAKPPASTLQEISAFRERMRIKEAADHERFGEPVIHRLLVARSLTPTGSDIAFTEWNGRHFVAVARHGALAELARQLIAAGAPGEVPWMVPGEIGGCEIGGCRLAWLADLTTIVVRNPAGKLQFAQGDVGFA